MLEPDFAPDVFLDWCADEGLDPESDEAADGWRAHVETAAEMRAGL